MALKLALELSESHKVLLVDSDSNLSNSRLKLELPLSEGFDRFLNEQVSFEAALYRNRNFHLLSGANGSFDVFNRGEDMVQGKLLSTLSQKGSAYDYIVIDSAAGISPSQLALSAYCDHRIFVITPDEASITDAYSVMKILKMKHGVNQNCILGNRIDKQIQFKRIVKSVWETAENFLGTRAMILGYLPEIDVDPEDFDHFCLFDRESAFHKKFLKVLDSASEHWLGSSKHARKGQNGRAGLPEARRGAGTTGYRRGNVRGIKDHER